MAGYLKVNVKKLEVQAINTKVPSEIFEEFQKRCKERNFQMCTIIETFARQYANGRYKFNEEDITKWKNYNGDVSTLNTPINRDVYYQFKDKVKADGYFVKHILSAFIEDYGNNDLTMEFVQRS